MEIIIEFGHTIEEWSKLYDEEQYWDFEPSELFDGTVEITHYKFWCIDGRLYEVD